MSRVLFLDIETAPSLGYFFGKMYETNIVDLESGWYILCYSYRWADSKTIKSVALPDFKQYKKNPEDDKALCGELWTLLDRASVVVCHNVAFDVKKVNARLVKHAYPPYSPIKTFCTLQAARRNFAFTSNSLNSLGRYFHLGRKLAHSGWDLWRKVMGGDTEAWATMRRYCSRDVELLFKVYTLLRAWGSHPKLTPAHEDTHCPTCESKDTLKRGVRHYKTRSRQERQCRNCHKYFLAETVT